jgi:hypothetical protein
MALTKRQPGGHAPQSPLGRARLTIARAVCLLTPSLAGVRSVEAAHAIQSIARSVFVCALQWSRTSCSKQQTAIPSAMRRRAVPHGALFGSDADFKKRGRSETRSGLQNCAATSVGGTGVSRCCRRQSRMRGHRAACIKRKFTTDERRQPWMIRTWLTEEAAPGVPLPETASPVHLSHWQGRQAREF